jgi:hypothetical protein
MLLMLSMRKHFTAFLTRLRSVTTEVTGGVKRVKYYLLYIST